MGRGAEVLGRPAGGLAESGSGVEGPVGVAEELAGEEDEVGLAGGDDGVSLGRISDEADGGGGDVGFAADAGGEGDLEAWADGDFGVGDLAAGGDIDQINAMVAEEMGELDGVVDGPACPSEPSLWRRCGRGGAGGGPCGADGVDDLEEQAGAIFKAAAVGVRAVVGEGREELVEQVAVGGVDLDEIEAGGEGAEGGEAEGFNGGVDGGLVEGLGDGVGRGKSDGAGSDGLPTTFSGKSRRSVEKGGDMLALRPAWASWMPARAPWEWRNRAMR